MSRLLVASFVLSLLFGGLAASSPATAARSLPELRIEILSRDGKPLPMKDGIVLVPRHERIRLNAVLEVPSLGDAFEPLEIDAVNQAPGYFENRPPPNLTLRVTKIDTGRKEDVAVRVVSSGGGQSLTVYHRDVTFDILEDPAVRERKMKAGLGKLIDAARAQAPPGSPPLGAAGTGEGFSRYFDEVYVDNPPGLYEVVLRYRPSTPGKWSGVLVSAPARARVESGKSFFEVLEEAQAREAALGPRSAHFRVMEIDPTSLEVTLRDPLTEAEARRASHFHRFRSQSSASIDHLGAGEPGALYGTFTVDSSGRLLYRSKRQRLLSGAFGTVYAESTYYYSGQYEGQRATFRTVAYANVIGAEAPEVSETAPADAPSVLTAMSLVRVFRAPPEYLIVSADYDATGKIRSLHVNAARNGDWVHSNEIGDPYRKLGVATMIGDRPEVRSYYGLPEALDRESARRPPSAVFSSSSLSSELDTVCFHFDHGAWIRQDFQEPGSPFRSRYLSFHVTEQDRILAPVDASAMPE